MTDVVEPQFPQTGPTAAEIADIVRELYADVGAAVRMKQTLRPYICPFHVLVRHVPPGASLLDVGCGSGLFILLLAHVDRVRRALGFDASRSAIEAASAIAAARHHGAGIRFERRDANDAWPEGQFGVVSVIDVMHHVPPGAQRALLARAAAHVADGGILLYKDMASRPLMGAWANRLHDLASAGDWINYAELGDVIGWARAEGLRLESQGAVRMLWYHHEWCVFRKPQAG